LTCIRSRGLTASNKHSDVNSFSMYGSGATSRSTRPPTAWGLLGILEVVVAVGGDMA
jgi:hypothetical protein